MLRKTRKTQETKGQYLNLREPFKHCWTATCQQAFDEIIDKLTSAPILGFADPKLPYILRTDASTMWGWLLSQVGVCHSVSIAIQRTNSNSSLWSGLWLKSSTIIFMEVSSQLSQTVTHLQMS